VSERFALRLSTAGAASLGPLRLTPGLEVCALGDALWLRGTLSEELQPRLERLPASERYALEGELLRPPGASLPCARAPDGPWRALVDTLPFAPQPPVAPSGARSSVQLELGPADEEREATFLLTSLRAFADWADAAPSARLEALSFAAEAGGVRVLVRGQVLPPLPGVRHWEAAGLVVPCGRTWRPALPAPLVAEALDLLPGELALFGEDGPRTTFERISGLAFVPARRAAVRATLAEAGR
jgi:hypothetical protein